jgi:class I fructose-bisphosphate aldolase/fructose-bisphosphate aldolase/2-amino-3,7-dideoxy-D-threo-hept-6-ulosonate synthase
VSARGPLGADGRSLIVAVDHPLYSWPCAGLEDRTSVLRAVSDAGADAIICSYGTLRDLRDEFQRSAAILKLDVTTIAMGGHYPVSEYALAYRVEDAVRLGAAAVLTYVQLGTPFELDALRTAARVAARADELELQYVCEIMPVEGDTYRDAAAPLAIAAAARTAAELGAHIVKTTMPTPPEAVADAVGCGVPVVLAGGDFDADEARLLDGVRRALDAGAAGVAQGRNVWGRPDPAAAVAALRAVVHPEPATVDGG